MVFLLNFLFSLSPLPTYKMPLLLFMMWEPLPKFSLNFFYLQCHLFLPLLQHPLHPEKRILLTSCLSPPSLYHNQVNHPKTQSPAFPSPSNIPEWLSGSTVYKYFSPFPLPFSSFRCPREDGFRVRTSALHFQEFHLISSLKVHSH